MKTNTKKNFLKLAMTIVAMLIFTGATGQILTDYSETNATDMYQTVGTNFSVYVHPDPVYSPGYGPLLNENINPNSYWTFTVGVGLTSVTDITDPIPQNWVEVTASSVGSSTITAAERFTLAGCVDATPQSQVVNVLPVPTAVIAGGNANSWTELVPDFNFFTCSDGLAEDLTITITETGVPAELAAYAYAIERVVEEIDELGDVVVNTNNATTTPQNITVASKLLSGNVLGGAVHNVTTGAMPLLENASAEKVRTRYTFTLRKPTGAPLDTTDGIVSAISHKSNYGGAVQTYPFGTDVSVVYVVNLPPVTGPIYHIPNNFGL